MWNRYDNFLTKKLDYFLDRIKNGKIVKKIDELSKKLDNDMFIYFCLGFLVCLTVSRFFLFFTNYNYYFDSFMVYDISKSIFVDNFQDFGRVSLARHFQQNLDHFRNSAFPLLFPFLMACFNKIFSAGLVAGTIINFFLVFVIYYINLKISKKLTNSLLCGIMINFALILNRSFYIELFMGFSIPLIMIFYQLIVYIFLFNKKIDTKLALIIGIIAGLALNTRFDTQLPMLSVAILISLKNKKISIKETLIFIGTMFLFMLPWIIYSKTFFNVFYASDNSRAVLASGADGLDFYSPTKIDTIFNKPFVWIKTYFTKKLPMISVVFYMNLILNTYFLIPILFFKNNFKKDRELTYSYVILYLMFLALFGTITLSGFFWEVRYFLPITWFISLIIVFYYPNNKKYLQIVLILIILIFSITQLGEWYGYIKNYEIYREHQKIYLNPKRFDDIVENIKEVDDPTIMFLYTNVKFFRLFSVLTSTKSFSLSGNIHQNETLFKDFIKDYDFDYIYVDTSKFKNFDFDKDIYEYDYEKCNFSKISKNLPERQKFECLSSTDIKTGLANFVEINDNLFKEIKKYFYIIPTKNKSLFRVIRK